LAQLAIHRELSTGGQNMGKEDLQLNEVNFGQSFKKLIKEQDTQLFVVAYLVH
jgi:hypothetical protein